MRSACASGRQTPPARASAAFLQTAVPRATLLQRQKRHACKRRARSATPYAVSNGDGAPDPEAPSTSGRAGVGARPRIGATTSPARQLALTPPMSELDVDRELWEVLDLCSDEELEALYGELHSPSPFSPVVKSLVQQSEPALVALRGRTSLMHKVGVSLLPGVCVGGGGLCARALSRTGR